MKINEMEIDETKTQFEMNLLSVWWEDDFYLNISVVKRVFKLVEMRFKGSWEEG